MTDFVDEVIRASDNRTLKLIRSLRLRNAREAERAFVVEGIRAVEDALLAGGAARVVLVREDSDWRGPGEFNRLPIRRVSARLFDSLAETVSPQPVLAVFEIPDSPLPLADSPLVLVVDGVRDPGNLGTLLRSAAAAGVAAAVLTSGTVDPFNGKAVRAGMGAQFRLPLTGYNEASNAWLQERSPRFVLAEAQAATVYTDLDWRGAVTLVIGSETDGPTAYWRERSSESVRIPLQNSVESLNAGVAGSIILFEAARQRAALDPSG